MAANEGYETYEVVPAGTNLLEASRDQLDLYGIPPRPDARTEPQLFAFWQKLVSPPFSAKRPSFSSSMAPMVVTRAFKRASRHDERIASSNSSNWESSLNWSGAVLSPPFPKRIVFAVGGWSAPSVRPAALPALFTHSNDHKSLVWVGIDGHNGRLPKISLPQIGTAHWPGVQQFAWWDWWKHGQNSHIRKIDDFAIAIGDEILAGLLVLPGEDILFFIKNQTTGEFRSFLALRRMLGIIEPLGTSAEWVLERPTEPSNSKLYPLPAFDPVHFKHCLALSATRPGPTARLTTLAHNGRMVRMREAFADPYRTVYVSRAKRRRDLDGSIGITCTFHGPT